MTRLFQRLLISICVIGITFGVARPSVADEEPDGMTYHLGADVRFLKRPDGKYFKSGRIPQIDMGFPIAGRRILMEVGWRVEWGFTKFYVDHFPDFLPSLGLRVYPLGEYISLFGSGGWGTFIFNNSTLDAEAGIDLDLPMGHEGCKHVYFMVGAGFFRRHARGLGNFIEPPQWWLVGNGYMIRFGLRGRYLEPTDTPTDDEDDR